MATRFEVRIVSCEGDPEYERETQIVGNIGETWSEASEDIVRLLNGAFIAAYGYRMPIEFAVKDLKEDTP